MLYLTGFQNWEKQTGKLFSIANSEPDGFKGHVERLRFLVPDWETVNLWKSSYKTDRDWETFVNVYRVLCRSRWEQIARWLETLKPEEDVTLLCWERHSSKCHRSLVAKIVQHYRPDCYGGLDVPNPYRKTHKHRDVAYNIWVVDCPWSKGFSFSLSVGGGISKIGDNPDHPYIKGAYALPECAIAGAVEFIKAD